MDKYAYVTVLYGNNSIYLTGALVLGYSLMKTRTPYDRIIMVTYDIRGEYRSYLKKIYTHIIEIGYIRANPNIFLISDTRFKDVFTKLECLSLIQYDKIILLDLDMIVLRNIDHLFDLTPPAACLKKFYIPYGNLIPKNMICRGNKLVGSINAGLMLLKPDIEELKNIKKDISENTHRFKFKYPEQDFLSLRYCGKWRSITFNYNFQFGLTKRVKKYHYKVNDIYVIHYSSSYKPWNDLITDKIFSDEEIKFKEKHKNFYILWINIYNHIKKKFKEHGVVLPY